MKKIKLTQDKFVLVDNCDYEYLNQWKWCVHKEGSTFYAVRHLKENHKKFARMHRVILQRMGIKFQQVDHIDGNGLNNQRLNLRLATNQENRHNQRLAKNNTSGFKGVSWHKQAKKWCAYIKINSKKIHLGSFNDIKEAARAYNKAAIKHFGKFAFLNKV